MASDRLPVNAEMSGNVPVGPAASRKCQNCLNFRHLELIRHRTIRLRREPKANGNGQISSSSKWPVLARPSLAGFARPLTEGHAKPDGNTELLRLRFLPNGLDFLEEQSKAGQDESESHQCQA